MTTPTVTVPTDPELADLGVTFLNAILDSANLSPTHMWDRAKSALETGMTAGSFGEAVSAVGRKLEIHGAFRPGTTKAIGELAGKLADPAVFGAFAEVCSRDAPFVVAMTRLARQARREETKK